jgi:hypothetical protein
LQFFNVSGLVVASEIDLPWRPADAVATPDVTIRQGETPAELAGAVEVGPTWRIAGDQFLLRIPGIARFLLTNGREITFEIEDGAAPEDVAVFIMGTVFGILLHQRQQIVLHASAVRVGDRAVLFCGPSGAGKSTMAAALNQKGYQLLTDDVCAIDLDASGVLVAQSDGRRLKLWEQAIKGLDLAERKAEAVRSRLEKFYVEPHEPTSQTLPLGAVYVLRELRAPHKEGVERPNVVDAALFVRRNACRPRLVAAMAQKDRYFRSAAAIAAGPGVFLLTRPLAFKALPGVIEGLERHWREIGLIGATP